MGYMIHRSWLHLPPMKVFLSWSKEPSKSLATFLRGWLTDVIQSLDPWMSAEDIPVGDRWANQISGELESRNYGILILTPENQFQPWINYEAGALSKLVGSSRVIPYTFGFKPADVSSPPLTAFQGVEATEEGTWRMLEEINKGLAVPLAEIQLRRAFEKNWSDLDTELKRIAEEEAKREKANPGTTPPPRSDSDKLDEALVLLRNISADPSERALRNIRLTNENREKLSADNLVQEFYKTLIEEGIPFLPMEIVEGDPVVFKILLNETGDDFEKHRKRIIGIASLMLPRKVKVEIHGPPSTRIAPPPRPRNTRS